MTESDAAADATDMVALRRGEKAALDRLMNRWQMPLRGFFIRHGVDEATALDLAHETFVRVFRNAASYQPGKRFSTWMFAIGLNLLRDLSRTHQRRKSEPLSLEMAADLPGAHARLEADERAVAVRNALGGLSDELRTVVVLSEYEDLSHAEIAEVVGATAKAVESRLYRARQQLKKTLASLLG